MVRRRPSTLSIASATLDLFCQEPFRIFFPVGLLLGAIGVSLWVLYYAGITALYPGVSHARMMIEGFIASSSSAFSEPQDLV
ncbi:MAG: NnrS family protein [Verrucomicrobia bacterium]|nr:NnrS family protein [Verrucomicrobiota bacterium]